MSNISSNCLFHFTPKLEYLIGILENEFYPRYCHEKVQLDPKLKRSKIEGAIPMVCFCDLSLSQINDHIDRYGHYGIGMNKEWGKRKKLNPVIYLNERSTVADSFGELAEMIYALLISDTHNNESIKATDNLQNIAKFLKPHIGDFRRGKELFRKVNFYNEREWRFVPDISFESDVQHVLNRAEYMNPETLNNANKNLEQFALRFTPSDIKYIFVKSEDEIHNMVQSIRNIKGPRFSEQEVDILTSKILTTRQIREDF